MGWRWFLLETCPSDLSLAENYQQNTYTHAETHTNPQAPPHTLYNSHPLLRFKTRFSSFVPARWHLYGGHFVLLPTCVICHFIPTPYSKTWNILGHPVTHDFHQTDNTLWLTTWRHYTWISCATRKPVQLSELHLYCMII